MTASWLKKYCEFLYIILNSYEYRFIEALQWLDILTVILYVRDTQY